MQSIVNIISWIIVSVGGAGVVILSISHLIGNIWANKFAEKHRVKYEKELEHYKSEINTRLNNSIEKNKLYDEILKQMNLKRVENKEIKKLTRNRIVKYIENIFIHEDKSVEINFKEDINSI